MALPYDQIALHLERLVQQNQLLAKENVALRTTSAVAKLDDDRKPSPIRSPSRYAHGAEKGLQEDQQTRVHQKLLQDFVTLKREFAELKKSKPAPVLSEGDDDAERVANLEEQLRGRDAVNMKLEKRVVALEQARDAAENAAMYKAHKEMKKVEREKAKALDRCSDLERQLADLKRMLEAELAQKQEAQAGLQERRRQVETMKNASYLMVEQRAREAGGALLAVVFAKWKEQCAAVAEKDRRKQALVAMSAASDSALLSLVFCKWLDQVPRRGDTRDMMIQATPERRTLGVQAGDAREDDKRTDQIAEAARLAERSLLEMGKELDAAEARCGELNAELDEARASLDALEAARAARAAEVDTLRDAKIDLEAQLEAESQARASAEDAAYEKEQECAELEEQLKAAASAKRNLQKAVASSTETITARNQELAAALAKAEANREKAKASDALREEVEVLQGLLKKQEARVRAAKDAEVRLGSLEAQQLARDAEQSELQLELQNAGRRNETLAQALERSQRAHDRAEELLLIGAASLVKPSATNPAVSLPPLNRQTVRGLPGLVDDVRGRVEAEGRSPKRDGPRLSTSVSLPSLV